MRPLGIVRICEQFPPSQGGLSSGMLDLSMAQHERGHVVTVIAPSAGQELEFDAKLPFGVIRVPSKRIVSFAWKAYKVIQKLTVPPDIIHSHGPSAFYYLMLRKPNSAPLIHTLHAIRKYQFEIMRDVPLMVSALETKYKIRALRRPEFYNLLSPQIRKDLFLERYICKRADHIAVVAEYFANQVKEYYGVAEDKITVIYNGSKFVPLVTDPQMTEQKGSLGLANHKRVILYVGRTDWVKRIHLLVEAMPSVLESFSDASLVVAGNGDQHAELRQLADRLGVSESVKLLGWIPHSDLPKLLANAGCFCLPSYWEGLSKALLEAMSGMVPVIAADNLANREVLRDGKLGWLVTEPSAEAWASTIRRVLSGGEEVMTKVEKAGVLLDSMYRWEHVVMRLDSAYERTLEKTGGNP